MPDIVGIRFKSGFKIYDFEVEEMDLKLDDSVVVESDFGLSIGIVTKNKKFIENPERPLKKVLRLATQEDLKAYADNKEIEKEAKVFCLERIMARGLQMKLVEVEATLDRKRIIFYFTADGRIDFRELVKDLAAKYKTRIEMRQIGVRDEAKLAGGIGICGRELCCKTFLTSFEPISIKMAKKQEVVLNITKLSGLCSKLMCCLKYEYDERDNGNGDLDSKKELQKQYFETDEIDQIALYDKLQQVIPNSAETTHESKEAIHGDDLKQISNHEENTKNISKHPFRFKKRRNNRK